MRSAAMGKDGQNAYRVTTTLTHQQHEELERIGKQSGVKVAWLVRRAVDRLIKDANGGTLPIDFGPGGPHA